MPILSIGNRGSVRKAIAAIHVNKPGFFVQRVIRDMNMAANHAIHALRGGIGESGFAEITDEGFADFFSGGGKIKLPRGEFLLHVEIAFDNPVKGFASFLIPVRISAQIGGIESMPMRDGIARGGGVFLSVPGFKDGIGGKKNIVDPLSGQGLQNLVVISKGPYDVCSAARQCQDPVEDAVMFVRIEILFMLFSGDQGQKIIEVLYLVTGTYPLFDHFIKAVKLEFEINHIPDHIKCVQRPGGIGAGQKNILQFNSGIGMEKVPV